MIGDFNYNNCVSRNAVLSKIFPYLLRCSICILVCHGMTLNAP